jgi:hypothetical protein
MPADELALWWQRHQRAASSIDGGHGVPLPRAAADNDDGTGGHHEATGADQTTGADRPGAATDSATRHRES